MQSKEVYIKLGQSLEICVHNPDEDDQDKDDPDETHDEIAQDNSHEMVKLDSGCGDAGFEALVLNVSTICLSIQTNYKANSLYSSTLLFLILLH